MTTRRLLSLMSIALWVFTARAAGQSASPGPRDAAAQDSPAQDSPARDSSAATTHATGAAPSGWLAQVEKDLAAREYEMTWQATPAVPEIEASWHAPNRAQGFRTYFTTEGIRVVPRTAGGAGWRWGLALVGYGRGAASQELPRATLAPAGRRIEYQRGALTERYENTERGLEQTFILPAPPVTSGPGGHVHLDLALWGDLTPRIATDGGAIDFVTASGAPALHYAQLQATDASGETVPAWMEGFARGGASGIRLVVDAERAVYPITIDPLATSAAWTAEGNQPGAQFAWSVATAGDVNGDGFSDVIVGAPLYDAGAVDEGRAFVYRGSPAGLSIVPLWFAEDGLASSQFGGSVASAGDVNGDGYADVIVGAPTYSNGQSGEGAAFVYLGSPGGPAATPAWTAESNIVGAHFGQSVATAGDVNRDGLDDVIVGAPTCCNGLAPRGQAFVYLGTSTGLSSTAIWSVPGGMGFDSYGLSVATAGDVNGDGFADVIVGAPRFTNGQTNEGQAYVYLGGPAGPQTTPIWTTESNQVGAELGNSVATAGDVNGDGFADVVVGAHLYDDGQTDEGAAFLYLGSPTGPTPAPVWETESNENNAQYGASVATAGDVNGDGYADVVVGAPLFDAVFPDEGQAYLYLGSGTGAPLSFTASWTVLGGQNGAQFGFSVATAGDVNGDGYADVLVGADLADDPEPDEGKAYLFLGSAAGPSQAAGWTTDGQQLSANLGTSVSTAGDVNGDGYADVIVGAPLFDNGQVNEGVAFLFPGSPSGPAPGPTWIAQSDQAGALFGSSVSTAGDVNGDGYADVVVGAPNYTNGEFLEGKAYVYLGSPTGLAASPIWTVESNQNQAKLGTSVGTAGDVNGDGFADVIVGAPFFAPNNAGSAFLYRGSASGPSPTPTWTAHATSETEFGWSVGTAGDVNGDGYADVIVGAPSLTNGHALVFLGGPAGLQPGPSWVADGGMPGINFGTAVATAGDVNGDGYADVIVGAPAYTHPEPNEGRVYVYLGSPVGLQLPPAWTFESNQPGAQLGTSVGTAGDVNGDGYADVIAGAPYYDVGLTDEGQALVFAGSPAGPSPAPIWTASGGQTSANFGMSVASAGDVNGDGYADVVVGAPYFDNTQTDEGRASVFYGNGGPGLSVAPQQRRADDSAPIAPGGRTLVAGSFNLAALGRTPFGRGRVRLEWEIKPLGSLFDGTGTQMSAAALDTPPGGVHLDEPNTGLGAGDYHWRARLRYDHPLALFARSSRWFTPPWNGWEETDVLVSGCTAPTLQITISDVRPGPGPNEVTIDYADPNPPANVTGYNVYRTTDPTAPPAFWTLLANNVGDQDPATPGLQWIDTTGDNPPAGTGFYYKITAYNAACGLEGPY